jgi:integrase
MPRNKSENSKISEPLPRHPPPIRRKNSESRERGEFLTPEEVERLCAAAASVGRHRDRDYALVFLAYRHAYRVSEIAELAWEKINMKAGTIWISRKKGSNSNEHPLHKDEIKALKKVAPREEHRTGIVFANERGGKLTESCIRKLVARAGKRAGFPFHVHPHQLRHACGHTMANKKIATSIIAHWLGHVDERNTKRYAKIDDATLKGIWD